MIRQLTRYDALPYLFHEGKRTSKRWMRARHRQQINDPNRDYTTRVGWWRRYRWDRYSTEPR